MVSPIIKTKNLNVIYFQGKSNEIRALQNINLEIYPGEFIILFGPSGCGKSTLLYSIAGLQPNMSGDINSCGVNLTSLTPKKLEYYYQKKIGMIFQAFYLINSITVQHNVMLPQIAIGGKRKERTEKTRQILEHFGVIGQARKLPLELSGGQQQRVAICRALINDPEILLADEPVGNLDTKSAHDVMFLLQELNQKQKKTVILVTHDPAYLTYAHRIFYIRDGKIIDTKVNKTPEQVKPEELKISIPEELKLLMKTYSALTPNQISGLLIPFKAKQIVSDALTDMPLERTSSIAKEVESLLIGGGQIYDSIFNFLDEEKNGGIGIDKRTANVLADKINSIIEEIKMLEGYAPACEGKIADCLPDVAKQVCDYLLKTFEVNIKNEENIKVANKIIKERLDNKVDKDYVQKMLDITLKKGGAGIDKRIAKKMAQRLELLMLGKYK